MMRFNIHYHTISGYGYDCCDYQDGLFGEFEKKGYTGLTTSETSPWELREIRRWVKKQKQKRHMYMGKNAVFYTTDEDGYVDNCNCYWFSNKKQEEDFIKLLDNFPERKYEVEVETRDEEYYVVKKAFNKQQYKSNCRFVERNEDCPGSAVVQFSNQADAVAFKLKWA